MKKQNTGGCYECSFIRYNKFIRSTFSYMLVQIFTAFKQFENDDGGILVCIKRWKKAPMENGGGVVEETREK